MGGMRNLIRCCVISLLVPALVQASLDQSKTLTETRASLTSEFAKIQAQLRSQDTAARSAGETGLADLGPKVEALRDRLVGANQALISAFSAPPLFHGAYDPSATIVKSLGKMMTENRELASISLVTVPPFNPQDINGYQRALDRLKRGIDEHRHAAGNHSATVVQRQRKPVQPAKNPAKLPR
jgi:hypothetical protein